jgi:BMFP domain-containing protein YqiC
LNDFDVVQRDEFDLIKEMLIKEREKSALLEKKLNEIEKKLKKRNSTK